LSRLRRYKVKDKNQKDKILAYGQQPTLPTSVQPGRHSMVLSTMGLSHRNLGASNFQTHHAHHYSHLGAFLKIGQEEKFTEESLGTLHFLPNLHCSQVCLSVAAARKKRFK